MERGRSQNEKKWWHKAEWKAASGEWKAQRAKGKRGRRPIGNAETAEREQHSWKEGRQPRGKERSDWIGHGSKPKFRHWRLDSLARAKNSEDLVQGLFVLSSVLGTNSALQRR